MALLLACIMHIPGPLPISRIKREIGVRVLHLTPETGGHRVYNVNRRRAGPAMAVTDKTAEEPFNKNLQCFENPENSRPVSLTDRIFMAHQGGKIHVAGNFQIESPDTLSMAYTPGVGRVCQAIAADPALAYRLTGKGNSVAVVTDGSAVLGLGNLGPQAALPVMEGKAMLLRQLAGIDAWPICLDTQDPDEIVRTVAAIAPGFGGIHLEDISAPHCFEVERRLQEQLDIPVMHDDQHGTAVVVLAALINALKVTGRRLDQVTIVVNGLGAAGTACCQLLLAAGATHLRGCDKKGLVFTGQPEGLRHSRHQLPDLIRYDHPVGTLRQALQDAHVFIGLSASNVLTLDDLKVMAHDPIVFALANPDPELPPELGYRHCRIYANGRSDSPNQINNLLAFPGMFRGALDARVTTFNETMLLAVASTLADLMPAKSLSGHCIIPSVFDPQVVPAVANAISQAARDTGVARPTALMGQPQSPNRYFTVNITDN